MQIASHQYTHTPITCIIADGDTLVPRIGSDGKSEEKIPAKDCPVIYYKDQEYLRDDVFLNCYVNFIRYNCSTIWGYVMGFGARGYESDSITRMAIEAELLYDWGRWEDGDNDRSKWLKQNPINLDKIEKAVQRILPTYVGTNSSNHTYTYLSGEFIANIFRPLIPNTPLVKYSQNLSNTRFGAMLGLCLMIPELFIRTILNLTLSIAIAINKIRDPINAELQGVRYSMNQAAHIAVFNKCLLGIFGMATCAS